MSVVEYVCVVFGYGVSFFFIGVYDLIGVGITERGDSFCDLSVCNLPECVVWICPRRFCQVAFLVSVILFEMRLVRRFRQSLCRRCFDF